MNDTYGYVYILTNPSFMEDWVKIVKSSHSIKIRSTELENTAVPLPFNIYAVLKTAKYNSAERFIHKMVDIVSPDIKISKNQEFFNIPPRKAYDILVLCSEQYDDAEIEIFDEDLLNEMSTQSNGITQAHIKRSARLTFKMLGIPVGEKLTFYNDNSIIVKVVDQGSTVRIDDRELSLSAAARYINEKLGTVNQSGAYQGGLWFKYKGETLTDIRRRLGR